MGEKSESEGKRACLAEGIRDADIEENKAVDLPLSSVGCANPTSCPPVANICSSVSFRTFWL